jgi:nitrous oxide reductase accessory protein NosL
MTCCTHSPARRTWLRESAAVLTAVATGAATAGFRLLPLAAALSACGKNGNWPEGMQPIVWDRDTCVACSMVISDRRFAGQMRGGPKNTVFKFDDPGCMAVWLNDKGSAYPWMREAETHYWIADSASRGDEIRWIDARKAQFVTKFSPMGYNFGAVSYPEGGSVDFPTMCEHVVVKFKKAHS